MLCRLVILSHFWPIRNALSLYEDEELQAAFESFRKGQETLGLLFEEILTNDEHVFALRAQVPVYACTRYFGLYTYECIYRLLTSQNTARVTFFGPSSIHDGSSTSTMFH